MTDERLSADQVADLEASKDRLFVVARDALIRAERAEAQDGRWRALAGELLTHVQHAPLCPAVAPMYVEFCECGLNAALAQAQAALDGAPGER